MSEERQAHSEAEALKHQESERKNTGRTPGRKLIKEDLASTSVLIRGCTVQTCCRQCPTCSGD